jgi:aspartate/tyrosine/aromatic aminotransferase
VGSRTGRHARAHQADAPGPGQTKLAGRRREAGPVSFITRQKGMFSYSGLNKEQMQRLRSEFGVYGVDSGRICVAALNNKNIDAVVSAIAKVS